MDAPTVCVKRKSAQRSGYTDFEKPITLATPYSEEAASGHTFAPRRIAEIVPGRVYVLTGFEFTEYYFIVSEDGHQLIGVDAGTRPDSAKAAYESLRAYAPGLPPLTTIFFTHAHWDHIGGHSYFESLTPRPRSYARSNYQEELTREIDAPQNFGKPFFGERFSWDDTTSAQLTLFERIVEERGSRAKVAAPQRTLAAIAEVKD